MAVRARWRLAVGIALTAALAGAARAFGGPVDFGHGEARLEAGNEPAQIHAVAFPGTADYSIDASDATASAARLRYDARGPGGGAVFEVTHDHEGDARGSFTVTFTTVQDLHYSLFAEPGINFTTTLDDVVADAFFDPLSTGDPYRGSLVIRDEETGRGVGFGAKTFQGELPAGVHTFSMRAFGGIDRGTPISGEGFARLTLAPAAIAILLPPAVGPALLTALCFLFPYCSRRLVHGRSCWRKASTGK